ncbi:hypothetical protein LLEC1_05943 [Akanthomyces lecanii]|uniref:Uncharacterized protein n=1 Tax=Cordyceps confragosa TaxID=2714763 RepID=A0A179I5M3_CORDF|nr:hypothetical protein LLEC1_05943 [Akanthomyces lecanii]
MSSGDGLDSELESFRKQWLSDLSTQRGPQSADTAGHPASSANHRRRQSHSRRHDGSRQSFSSSSARPGPLKKTNGPPSPTAARRALILDEGSDYVGGRSFDEPAPPFAIPSEARTLGSSMDAAAKPRANKLVSALDHYEEAMEKEAEGNMGDSLQLYRKAYKMDHGVERRYREKHFPTGASKAPFGFAGMHYRWNSGIEWDPLSADSEDEQDDEDDSSGAVSDGPDDSSAPRLSPRERAQRRHARLQATTLSLTPSVYPTWKKMFRNRPRIRFDGSGSGPGAPSGDDDLSIETEGVGTKYIFKMDLQVRSAGKATAARNNKLVLSGFYSYNKLTEDWAEFLLKNNKPFFFSRVRSYGLGD